MSCSYSILVKVLLVQRLPHKNMVVKGALWIAAHLVSFRTGFLPWRRIWWEQATSDNSNKDWTWSYVISIRRSISPIFMLIVKICHKTLWLTVLRLWLTHFLQFIHKMPTITVIQSESRCKSSLESNSRRPHPVFFFLTLMDKTWNKTATVLTWEQKLI